MSSYRVVKQTRLKDLRAKNYQGSNEEWIKTVSLILGQSSAPLDESDWPSGLEASAHISGLDKDNKELVITIRKRVETITVRGSHPSLTTFMHASTDPDTATSWYSDLQTR